ncbi:MAG: hypothetical protein JO290_05110 [Sphingomonadaceae bacterium]|nr:hypothetical protein [Sphingomonadaceae bacterium]
MSPDSLVILSTASLAALATLSAVFAWSWKGWLDLRRHALDRSHGGDVPVANRIDLADLKERIRKLEAIAAGVDL